MSELKQVLVVGGNSHHACAIILNGFGILITGQSGAGKTSLSHGLIEGFAYDQRDAAWVCDDRVCLTLTQDGLIATAPAAIAGKAELYGYGVIDIPHRNETMIDLVVTLVPDNQVERMPGECHVKISDIAGSNEKNIPLIEVPARHESQSVRLVRAMVARLAKQKRA